MNSVAEARSQTYFITQSKLLGKTVGGLSGIVRSR